MIAVAMLLVGAHLLLLNAPVSSKNVVCYFHNWAQYRPSPGQMYARNVNHSLCSHLIFAFSQLSGNSMVPYEFNDDTSGGQWQQLNELKLANPKLKTLLALGGYSHGSARFHQMASSQASRADFISKAINLLRYKNFDGLDLDWEYPSDLSPDDFNNFANLIKETREAFEREATIVNNQRLILSVAVAAGLRNAIASYNVTALDQYVDIVNVMSYDYHGLWESVTGLNAPLLSMDGLDVSSTINWYLGQGLRPSKIHLGFAFFGRTFTLANPANNNIGAPTMGGGINGTYTRTSGILAYYEICDLIVKKGYTVNYDAFGQQKYAYSGNQWVSYDDVDTMSVKVDYLLSQDLGGAMIWSLPEDDFSGLFCGQYTYPLTSYISGRVLNAPDKTTASTAASTSTTTASTKTSTTASTTTPISSTTASTTTPISSTTSKTTTPTASTSTTTKTTTPTASSTTSSTSTVSSTTASAQQPIKTTFTCPSKYGFFADPTSCLHYYVCNQDVPLRVQCPVNTIYNSVNVVCEKKLTTSFVCPI